jgi:signal transduction histidine kinase
MSDAEDGMAISRQPWRTAALLAVALAVLAAGAIAEIATRKPEAEAAVALLALLAIGLLLALGRRPATAARTPPSLAPRELESLIAERTRELSALSTHLQQLTEKEKAQLARHLHDELGGLLTAAKMDLSWLQPRIADPGLQERLTQLGAVLDEAMDLKRRVVEDLRPSLLDHFGLPTALRAYVESVCAHAGLTATLELPQDGGAMPRETSIALFRIVQEGITNVVRHAGARSVTLRFELQGAACRLTLCDDGCGFDTAAARSGNAHGIMGMRQRALAISGRLELDSIAGAGTTLRVIVPAP